MPKTTTQDDVFEMTTKLLTTAIKGATDAERLIGLDKLLESFEKHGLHPSQLCISLVSDDDRGDKAENRKLRKRVKELDRLRASLEAENDRLERLRTMAAQDASRKLAQVEQQYHGLLAAERTAKEVAEARAAAYRQALADRVARSKRSRAAPLDETAFANWRRVEAAGADFGRRLCAAVAAIAAVSVREIREYSELRRPIPEHLVERVEAYVAANGCSFPDTGGEMAFAKPRQRSRVSRGAGLLSDQEVVLLSECKLDPTVVQERLNEVKRDPTNLDRRLALVLAEAYGVEPSGIGTLLGLQDAALLLERKRDWFEKLSHLAHVPLRKLEIALRKRKMPMDWMNLLPQAVAS